MGISQSPLGGMAVISRKETRSDARRFHVESPAQSHWDDDGADQPQAGLAALNPAIHWPGTAFIDARRLTEARLELVSHAHNYSSGTIELDGHVDRSMHPPCLVPTLSDQGPGIPTAMQDDIVERFLRRNVEASTGASCGRGLSIEKSITENHGLVALHPHRQRMEPQLRHKKRLGQTLLNPHEMSLKPNIPRTAI